MQSSSWTENRNEAKDFDSLGQAIDFCIKNSLKNVEVVLAFPDPALDVIIPLPNSGE